MTKIMEVHDTTMTGTEEDNKISVKSTHNLPVIVDKPIRYNFDLGNLLILDTNSVPSLSSLATSEPSPDLNIVLTSTARDCAQSLLNQLLTTCPIRSSSTGASLSLPESNASLPREKRVPKPRVPTKWENFAAKKGIASKERKGKMIYDEAKGEWVPKWGFKGQNKEGDGQWLVELDDSKNGDGYGKDNGRAAELTKKKANERGSKSERKERVKRNERKMRANEKRSLKVERLKS